MVDNVECIMRARRLHCAFCRGFYTRDDPGGHTRTSFPRVYLFGRPVESFSLAQRTEVYLLAVSGWGEGGMVIGRSPAVQTPKRSRYY